MLNKIFNFNQHNRDQWVARKAKEIPVGARVLDAGAGGGRYRYLFSHCDYKTQDFCQLPGYKYGEMDYICDIIDIPVSDESFDIILCTEVLEHVPEPIKVIEEFSRILRQGGRLLLSAPLGCGIHQQPYIFYGGYTPFWFDRFFPKYSLKLMEITPNGGFFKHYGQESTRFLTILFPDNTSSSARILTLPLKVMLACYFRVLMPFVCHYLDRMDLNHHFTVEYFVEAIKRG
ncbi:MAG: methyltransferase domain-containing protein [bacterium]